MTRHGMNRAEVLEKWDAVELRTLQHLYVEEPWGQEWLAVGVLAEVLLAARPGNKKKFTPEFWKNYALASGHEAKPQSVRQQIIASGFPVKFKSRH